MISTLFQLVQHQRLGAAVDRISKAWTQYEVHWDGGEWGVVGGLLEVGLLEVGLGQIKAVLRHTRMGGS